MHSWPLAWWPLLHPAEASSSPSHGTPGCLSVPLSSDQSDIFQARCRNTGKQRWMEWWNASNPHKNDVTCVWVTAESDKIRSEYRWMNLSQTHTFWWYLTPAPCPLQSYPELCWPASAIAQLSLASICLSASAVLKPGLAWPASHSQADPSDWLQVISNICNKNYIQHLVMFTNSYWELCDSYFLFASNLLC